VLNNRTTLEAFRAPVLREGPVKDGFSLGKAGNITEVFGENGCMMFLPMFSSLGDGISFPQRFTEDVELGQSNRWKLDSMNWGEERDESVPMLSAEIEDSLPDTDSEASCEEEDLAVDVKTRGSDYHMDSRMTEHNDGEFSYS